KEGVDYELREWDSRDMEGEDYEKVTRDIKGAEVDHILTQNGFNQLVAEGAELKNPAPAIQSSS
ncbi:MAG: hypothetical protein US51_C0001G0001, partial [Microgenomates group bacterium GW2011_GWA2_37_6]